MKSDRPMVTMLAGGGIASTSGGVGTLILYLLDVWREQPSGPRIRVIDTRGQGGKLAMIPCFMKAVAIALWLGLAGRLGIMHIHMNANGSAVRKCVLVLLGRLFRAPVIVHMHGADFREYFYGLPAPARKLLGFVINLAQAIIVLGNEWRRFLVFDVGVEPSKIEVIPNGVPGVTTSGPRAADAERPVRILFLGRLSERKGVPELLEALGSPLLSGKAWSATLAGDGSVEEFRQKVEGAGLGRRVAVPGWVDQAGARALLSEADILVLPSHQEGMPMAILEALAHRVAVVTTPVGAIPEILTTGRNALLVTPGATGELAAAIATLIDDPALRLRLGQAGNRLFQEQLDIRVTAHRIQALYGYVRRSAKASALHL